MGWPLVRSQCTSHILQYKLPALLPSLTELHLRHHLMQVAEGLTGKTSTGEDLRVREVWQDNLDSELEIIRDIVDDYPYIAMDTEFPGVVARPVGNFKNSGEYHYQTLR